MSPKSLKIARLLHSGLSFIRLFQIRAKREKFQVFLRPPRVYAMKVLKRKKILESKIQKRKLDAGHILFAAKSRFYEGKLKDYSRDGLFVETKTPLPVGEVLTVALPYMESKNIMCKGQVVWRKQKAIGIELLRRSRPTPLKLIK